MATYYAISTTGGSWQVLAVGDSRQGTEQAGYAACPPLFPFPDSASTDIYADTLRKNLTVKSHTEMRRYFPKTLRSYEDRDLLEVWP